MASSLPLYAAFRTRWSTAQVLAYEDQQREGGNMWFSSEDLVKPTTKFAIEWSSNNSQLVHLRCCYNNKYLVKESQTSHWINAAAEKPEDNTATWSCTLFRPIPSHAGSIQFLHVQSGSFIGADAVRRPINNNREMRLRIFLDSESTDVDNRYEVNIIDWDNLVVLPEQITFKGDNGKYLKPVTWTEAPAWLPVGTLALQFSSDDFGEAGVPQEVRYEFDGRIVLKNLEHDRNWLKSYAMGTEIQQIVLRPGAGQSANLFWPVKAGDNTIALNSYRYLCRNRDDDKIIQGDNLTSIVRNAMFEIGEPVLSRQVYGVNYRLADARIYDETPVVMGRNQTTNSTQETHFQTVGFSYEERIETSWRAFHSVHLGIRMSFRAGIPLIKQLRVVTEGTYDYEYEWGETSTQTFSHNDSYTFPVPPMTTVEARLLFTRGKCDVPFSYNVRDVLTSGRTHTYEVDGGVCTGINNYNMYRETVSHPLSRANE